MVDLDHGTPNDLHIPMQVKVDWSRWAHERTVNAGFNTEDSHKWLLERELDWKIVAKGNPPPMLRQQFTTPDGLFPQNWPVPDEGEDSNAAHHESYLVAALIMDDYDNQVPPDQVFPEVPFRANLNLEGRLMEASILYGMQRTQLETAISLAQERARVLNVQDNERYARHVPIDAQREREAREILLSVAPTEADVRIADRLGMNTTTIDMHASIDPNAFPSVAEVSAPAFSGPPHRLEVETRNNSASNASMHEVSATTEPAVPKAMPKSPPSDILPSQPTSQPISRTSWISFKLKASTRPWSQTNRLQPCLCSCRNQSGLTLSLHC
eukprot:941059-Amphidinium_carterae.1